MKGKEKDFTLLDPNLAKARHNRVQFLLDDEEYATLEVAAEMQATKAGELAGVMFRKHILPRLSDEVRRLQKAPETTSVDALKSQSANAANDLRAARPEPIQNHSLSSGDNLPSPAKDKAVEP